MTHDQEEALSMSDTICIMLDGAIVQIGGPRQLYDEPVNPYVAGFVGKSNFFDGIAVGADNQVATIRLADGRVLAGRIPPGGAGAWPGPESKIGSAAGTGSNGGRKQRTRFFPPTSKPRRR